MLHETSYTNWRQLSRKQVAVSKKQELQLKKSKEALHF